MQSALFWIIAAVILGGQALLVRAAWRMRRSVAQLPPAVPRPDARADLLWTLATAVLTLALLAFAYGMLP